MSGNSSDNAPSISPLESFSNASGMDPLMMKLTLSIIVIACLLLMYAWAVQHGYKAVVKELDIFGYLKLVLWGAGLFLCVIYFFIYR